MAHARYIHYDGAQNRLVAVYGDDAQQEDLASVVAELTELPGVRARATEGSMDDPNGPRVAMLELYMLHGADVRAAIIRAKQLTGPELPYTVTALAVTLLACQCGYISSKTEMRFVNGLEPEDQELFWLNYYAQIKRLSMNELLEDESYNRLMDTLQELLRGLGAYASELRISMQPDPSTCTHSQ